MEGYLLIDKPRDWTSFDVVNKVKSILRQDGQKIKVGHTGTLDPLATGLMVVLVGKATKQQDQMMKHDKRYEVETTLGKSSTTGDAEGELSKGSDIEPALEEIEASVSKFIGEIEQIPPAHSAIKVNGQRAYKLARKGKKVEMKPRMVRIDEIKITSYEYPVLKFTTKVSSGTYIRSLVSDIGEDMATKAYMSGLRRTQVGDFDLSSVIEPDSLDLATIKKHLRPLESPL